MSSSSLSIAPTYFLIVTAWSLSACSFISFKTLSSAPLENLPVVSPSATSLTNFPRATPISELPFIPTPIVWNLQIQFGNGVQSMKASPENLSQLIPGTSTLQDLYTTVGYPQRRKDYPEGIALLYPSQWVKDPHVVLLDGITGKVLVVSIENISRPIFSLINLKARYGEPIRVYTDGRDYLFFPNSGLAAIVDSRDNSQIFYIQVLPKNMTVEFYRIHQGFGQTTFGFVP